MMYHMSELVHKLHPHCSIIKSPLSASFSCLWVVFTTSLLLCFPMFLVVPYAVAAHIRYFTLCSLILIYILNIAGRTMAVMLFALLLMLVKYVQPIA